ncbi:MAG: FAD-dependent oxidoreductase [Candidatus Gracilibacteria bacterium]|jgi:ferredoxin-NADP reductase|nr:FAD-dependent oxidoreductase [Candidatus Gracilibacteria bacterium]MDD5178682.1 FAD-dependent oxidoreductase [Candidatus Gracilibacteria bacterium]
MASTPFTAKLLVRRNLAKDIYEVTFELVNPAELIYDAGNFLTVKVQDGITSPVMRAYTFACSGCDKTIFKLCFKVFRDESGKAGRGSGYLSTLPLGEIAEFFGPAGEGDFAVNLQVENPLWLLATGTGVAPLKAVAEKLTHAKSPRKIHLMLGVSLPEDKFYEEDFTKLQEANPNFTYQICVSRPGDDYTGCSGRIPAVLEKSEIPADAEFKICGSVESVNGIKTKLLELGFLEEKIDSSGFGAA